MGVDAGGDAFDSRSSGAAVCFEVGRVNYFYCWHKAGRQTRGGIVTCRHCGIGVEECPCLTWSRSPNDECPMCEGSGWVAMVRSRRATLVQILDFNGEVNVQDGARARKGVGGVSTGSRCSGILEALT